MALSIEDQAKINVLLARYCWGMDEGKGEEWAGLWTEDGSFTGIPEPLKGRKELQSMPPEFKAMGNGKFRHHITNVVIDAGNSPDTAAVKAYSMVTNWTDGGALLSFARVNFALVCAAGDWRIQSLHADMMT